MEKVTVNEEAFLREARTFVTGLAPRPLEATLVTLSGELGAGKTTFVKGAAAAQGVEDVVNSPTFVLEKIYQLASGKPFKRLVHIDAYRLERGSDLAPLGFDEIMKDPQNLVMLEWPERVADALPQAAVAISITAAATGGRVISYA